MRHILLSLAFVLSITSIHAQKFTERAQELGINHLTWAPNAMAGGLSVIDYDNDGFEDLYFIGGVYPDHLYHNLGNGQFEDVSSQMGLDAWSDVYTVGAVAGDLNNDGFTDLFITTHLDQPNILIRNLAGQSFQNITENSGLFGTKWSTTATMADIDRDGDLDIYVSNFVDFGEVPFFRTINKVEPNFLFKNLGDFKFTSGADLLSGELDGATLAACFTDIDNDLDADLFVINDFGNIYIPNELFVNVGNGEMLIEKSTSFSSRDSIDGMGVAIGDINEDGYRDYYISNIGENLLYMGGPEQFYDGAEVYDVNDGLGYSWGAFFADLDNDSHEELFVVKGSISESNQNEFDRLYKYDPSIQNFKEISDKAGLENGEKARAAVYTDLNNDGLLDIVINNIRIKENNLGKPLIHINQTENPGDFISLKLTGTESNRSAFGTTVKLYSGERVLQREVHGGSGYLGNSSPIVHFGIPAEGIDSILVQWPIGTAQSFSEFATNTHYDLTQGGDLEIIRKGIEIVTSIESRDKLPASTIYPNPAKDVINISLGEISTAGSVSIFDQLGRQMLSQTFGNNTFSLQLDVSGFPSGTYLVQVVTKSGTKAMKLLKR